MRVRSRHQGQRMRIAMMVAALAMLALMTSGSPTHASAQGDSTPRAYITVVIADGDDTVSWSDPDGCTSDYNTYLAFTSPASANQSTSRTSRTHIGSVASGSTEATQDISHGGEDGSVVEVELYCGTYDSNSSENALIAATQLTLMGPRTDFTPSGYRFRPGTYSSDPLTALAISSGTLSPAFRRGISGYSVEVPGDVRQITLDPTVLTGYETDFVRNPGWGVTTLCSVGVWGVDCDYSYGDGITTGVVLSDADTTKDGFQIDLTGGVNRLGIGVNKGRVGRLYVLTVTPQNSPAAGQPIITGIAQVGQTLTADTSGISDADGLTNTTFSYQWLSSGDTEIKGATNSTYTLRASDANKVVKVKVTFIDDTGSVESITSEPTGAVKANIPATGAPAITGTPEVGETLTADTSGIVDSDGLDNVSFRYQWIRSHGRTPSDYHGAPFTSVPTGGRSADVEIDGATGSTYTVELADVDKVITVRVDFTDDKDSIESLTSPATAVIPVEVEFTFSLDGSAATCDSYNVHAVNLPIEECDAPSSIDQGGSGAIGVEVGIKRSVNSQLYKFRFHIYQMADSIGHSKAVEANDLCLGTGLAESASMEVTPADGTGDFTYTDAGTIFNLCPAGTYQLYVPWYRYNSADEDYEHAGTFRRYFFINGNGEDDSSIEQVKSITAVYPGTPVPHGNVQIVGTKQSTRLNRTLTTFALSIDGLVSDSDTETTDYVVRVRVIGDGGPVIGDVPLKVVPWCHVGNVGYSYLLKTIPEDGQWAMDAHVLGNCLRGQWPDTLQVELFNSSYEFIAGKDILLGSLTNNPATGAPTISGTTEVGETLTADTSGIADADGLTNVTFSYQWLSSRDSEIDGATSSTYTLTDSDEGKAVKVRVTFTDDAGNEESLLSLATEAVTAVEVRTDRPYGLTVVARDGTIVLAWEEPDVTRLDGADDYRILRQRPELGEPPSQVHVAYTNTPDTSYTDTGVEPGVLYVYRVQAVIDELFGDLGEASEPIEIRMPGENANNQAAGQPTIAGPARVGETLAVDTSAITDGDGLANVAFAYRWLADDALIADAAGSTYTVAPEDEGKALKVRAMFTDDAGNTESLLSAATAAVRPPLTATAHDLPATHHGSNTTFAFEVRFSEEPHSDFSYVTMRDDAFTVTGGSVTGVRRLQAPSNVRWEMRVVPSGNGDVVIVLPPTADCSAGGAVCADDGGRLSNRLEITLSGPRDLALSDLDVGAGQELLAGALIKAGDRGRKDDDTKDRAWYATDTPGWRASGELRDGSLSWSYITLTRVAYFSSTGILRFNEADADFHLGDSFAEGGANYDLTIWIKTKTGTVSFLERDHIVNSGAGYINFSVPQADRATLDAVAKDDLVIVAVSVPADR